MNTFLTKQQNCSFGLKNIIKSKIFGKQYFNYVLFEFRMCEKRLLN